MQTAHVFEPGRSKYLVITTDFLLPIFIIFTVIGLIYTAFFSPVFAVKNITCSLDFSDCNDPSVLAELDKLKGQNIFRLQDKELRSRLTSGDFTIRTVEMKKTLPAMLTIELQSVYPVVALQVKGDSTWVVLDPRFRVIATRTVDPNVPTVIVPGPLTLAVGKPIEDSLLIDTLKLALRLGSEVVSVKTITLVDTNTIEILLASGIKAVFSPNQDVLEQIRSLQAVIGSNTITSGIRIIDVRFTQPVLR